MRKNYYKIPILIVFLIFSYGHSSTKIMEPGAIPVWVKWNNKTYYVKGGTVTSVGKKLGISEITSLSSQRVLYSIQNVSSDKEIAVEQLDNTYFRAVISVQSNKSK